MIPTIFNLTASLHSVAGVVLTLILTGLSLAVFGGFRVDPNNDFVKLFAKLGIMDSNGGFLFANPLVKTTSFTIPTTTPSGTLFSTRGAAGAVTFTLPAPSIALTQTYYEFYNVAGQNMTVSAGAGNGVALNNAACTSLTASTAAQLIGAHMLVICDGTSWLLIGDTAGVTYTVA